MKPKSADYLGKAYHCVAGAKTIDTAAVSDVAAFLSGPAKRPKYHRAVRSQFNRPAQHEPRIGRDPLTFTDGGYQFEAIADFGIGLAVSAIRADDATTAIDTAGRFIDAIAQLLLL